MTWTIKRTNQFKKNYQKLPEHIREKFKINFEKFLINHHEVSLKTHKLKGIFDGYFSSSINDDYRFITIIDEEQNELTLVNIGNHGIYK